MKVIKEKQAVKTAKNKKPKKHMYTNFIRDTIYKNKFNYWKTMKIGKSSLTSNIYM